MLTVKVFEENPTDGSKYSHVYEATRVREYKGKYKGDNLLEGMDNLDCHAVYIYNYVNGEELETVVNLFENSVVYVENSEKRTVAKYEHCLQSGSA